MRGEAAWLGHFLSRPVTRALLRSTVKILRPPIRLNKCAAANPRGESHGCDGESFERHCSRYFDGQSCGLFLWLFLTVAPVRSCI